MIRANVRESVFVSDLLRRRHAAIVASLRQALGQDLGVIPNTKDIWCRDYMPVEIGPGRYVQFQYRPAYLKGCPQLRTENAGALLRLRNCKSSRLVIDGGNIVGYGGTAILTNRVYQDNPRVGRAALRRRLCEELEIKKLIVVPTEPGDILGHADGVLRFVDERTMVVNDYRMVAPAYGQAIEAVLRRHGFATVRCPYKPSNAVGPDGIPSAVGVYINFLQTKRVVFCSIFGQKADDRALRLLEEVFPKLRVVPINCRELADCGGVLNCVTWNIREA